LTLSGDRKVGSPKVSSSLPALNRPRFPLSKDNGRHGLILVSIRVYECLRKGADTDDDDNVDDVDDDSFDDAGGGRSMLICV